MASVIRVCRKCGAKIFSDAPEGLCTGCVLETALGMVSEAVDGGGVSDRALVKADDLGQILSDSANEASRVKIAARVAKMLGEVGDYSYSRKLAVAVKALCFAPDRKA